MVLDSLSEYAVDLETLVEGLTARQVEPVIERLCREEEWELMSLAAISAAELPARLMINAMLEHQQFAALIPCACLRRHVRDIVAPAPSLGSKVFRDLDAEDSAGIPDHIRAEAEELASAADQRRAVAALQATQVDRDPLRTHIVERLTQEMAVHSKALTALVAIARASVWEETRRTAAMKIANRRPALQQLIEAGRTQDLIDVAANTGLGSARQNVAEEMGKFLAEYESAGDRAALEFISENHPSEAARRTAQVAAQALRDD